jgi:hypothetical protein
MRAPARICDTSFSFYRALSMPLLLSTIWELCLFRRGPDALPGAPAFTALALFVNLILSTVIGLSLGERSLPGALSGAVVATAVLASGLWFVLLLRGLTARFPQSFSALLCTDAVLSCAQWPVLLAWPENGTAPLLMLAEVGLMVWWLALFAFILSRALGVGRTHGTFLALGLFLLAAMATQSVLGGPS